MRLDDITDLKYKATKILNDTLEKIDAFEADGSGSKKTAMPPGLGIHPKGENSYQLAIRLAHSSDRALVQDILDKVSPENIDLQVTGPVIPFSYSLPVGTAIARRHCWIRKKKFGTLGCFVQKRDSSKEVFILSNAHVLVNLEQIEENNPIITCNSGAVRDWLVRNVFSRFRSHPFSYFHIDEIALLREYLSPENGIDAAIATLNDVRRIEVDTVRGYHERDNFLRRSNIRELDVFKIGARTGRTCGRITSFNQQRTVDYNPTIDTDTIQGKFDDFIEIKQLKRQKPFAKRGDSGAVVFDEDGYAVALVVGGAKYIEGLTYAIPISTVFDHLGIEPLTSRRLEEQP